MAEADSWDADNFEPTEPVKKSDKWEGEDEDEDVKDNWDDEDEEEEKKVEEKTTEVKVPEKKKLSDKIREKENQQKKKQEELRKKVQESEVTKELTAEEQAAEKLRLKKLQEESDLELAREAFGVENASSTTNSASTIDAMCPSSKEDFIVFEKMLKDKISQYDKSVHYSSFLESLFRELCISLEVDDLKKISTSLSVLLSEKQKQEKQTKGKKKKKAALTGGLKAKMKDDLADYGEFDGSYQDYEDFM
ncbi:eukaryotic translation initiation factor 3 subunit J-B isoform X1 [Chanos chanos]|uniref:Eukaryotic translation initiation factor 3 subunit J n=1 Tax=Chanos chanos TaxID=29144 RepID=A0A6J2UKJ5_CHACN|nr:eukaryotic translation initiation factor 3 subunit J-B-like isoform X1 [Chanos chanos]